MFEYHGWTSLRSTAEAVLFEPPLRLDEIRFLVDDLADYALMDLRVMNGEYFIHLVGMPNHRGTHGALIIELFGKVGQLAPGSYGLLYVRDPEPRGPFDKVTEYEDGQWDTNAFRVSRLVRGVVTERPDTLLSPVISTLEDAST